VLRGLTARIFNPLVLRLAGTRWLPLYGVIEHRGRRSGRVFHTPVVVRPIADAFIIPMPYGESTDWYRNVRAANGCRLLWNGRDYWLSDPQVVDPARVEQAFSRFQRRLMPRLGIRQCLRLRTAAAPAAIPVP
jgi:deazaflavin-dependent oxidoreductase (nitroreductase family)